MTYLKASEQRQKDDSEPKRLSPFSEMSRRDEGDGRSVADSYSSSYKNQFLTYHPADKKNNKPNAKMRTIPSQRRNLQN
ncbi:hypothetical protein NQ314_020345 [Rhamnusium bicolor]|uniref:Uncharacterized protein n=1 Tax=Rhamnusium bicolor TaxID=1586634 RepID=A0AAV8WLF3_9CUCU|nr:hypothetical protein NQ314_020345 [Rhamnusium bicolor]